MHPHAWLAALTLGATPTMVESSHEVPLDLPWTTGAPTGLTPEYPRAVEFVDELPKTLTGKIRRIELRERELR